MSDYARAGSGGSTHFTDKDALTSGDANKVVVGSQFDAEFNAIVTAVATKYDSDDLASQAQAEGETVNTVLMTPLRVANWADANLGLVGDLQALSSDPAADRLVFFDDTDNTLKFLTVSTGLAISGTNMVTSDGGIDHDALLNFVADEHVAHSGVTVTAGTGMTGGGTIDSTITLNVIGGNGITANANDIAITDQAVSATVPVGLTTGALVWDSSSITELTGSNVSQSADGYLVDDAGVLKVVPYDQNAVIVKNAETTGTLDITDANTIMEFDGTATLTIPLNSSVAFEIGTIIILVMDHATQVLTVTAAASVTLNSVFHPGGAAAASDTVSAGGTAVLMKIGTDEWVLNGNTVD
jgi:hypothetical protein